jgi:hypothetical protein
MATKAGITWEEFLAAGLDPQRRTAEVTWPARPAQHFRATQVLTLPELPDFRLDPSSLFA